LVVVIVTFFAFYKKYFQIYCFLFNIIEKFQNLIKIVLIALTTFTIKKCTYFILYRTQYFETK